METEKLTGKIKDFDFRPHVLGEQVSHILMEAILEGVLRGGDQLVEVELQKQFGVSRSPLREAFRDLEKKGLVVIIPRKGTYVKQVNRKDIEDNFMHRGWLKRWLLLIPLYIEWQMEQQDTHTPRATEINIENAKLEHGINIRGRIDRLDENQDQFRVIDYKTGYIPPIEDVLSGEAIQLPFYLLLLISQTEHELAEIISEANASYSSQYVDLGSTTKVSSKVEITDNDLRPLVTQNQQRLTEIMQQIHKGEALPAWGDTRTCECCPMDGLCRKQTWAFE